ncbi:hypothetical protein [Kribbella sp. CA-247076]|uniref:hypothetical protein n=1 Tax=Kribbella sp. CA-247076 TaxID=3239941 RepID=UPI003D8F18F2
MTAGRYVARIVEVPEHGIRLEPADGSVAPDQPTEVNLLGMAVALALGAAGYRHHAEMRDPELQTLDALLSGDTTMPWSAGDGPDGTAYIVCELNDGRPTCEVRPSAD